MKAVDCFPLWQETESRNKADRRVRAPPPLLCVMSAHLTAFIQEHEAIVQLTQSYLFKQSITGKSSH